MDLTFTESEEAFRQEARRWLKAHAPAPRSLASLDTAEGFEEHRRWERTMFEDRWSVVSWPVEYGGRGASIIEWLIFEEEYYRAQAPARVSQNGIFLLAPTLFEFGTEEQRRRFLPPMASGEEIWCQGWSEPDAGSDLAGIRSRATRDAARSGFVLEGQKTWCSRGAFAEWCFALARTDPEAERHRGLTYFLVPLDAPGVSVRPIAQLDGETGFAEIFFEGVFVPDDQVLGQVGQGWGVAMATAGSERGLNLRSPARYTEAARRLLALRRALASPLAPGEDLGLLERLEPDVGSLDDQVARAYADAEAYRLHTYWTASLVQRGGKVGAEASCNKVFWSETDLEIQRSAMALLGRRGEVLGPDASPGPWLEGYLFALAGPIYAGTNEVQRNVVAERLLGLPRA